jgi:transposase
MLPREYPPRSTVYHYFALFRDQGIWEQLLTTLRERCRVQAGREATPSAGIIDSQSVRTTERGGPHGYDGGKKLSGRKRHIFVDTTGLLLKVVVHVANIQDREGVKLLLQPLKGTFPHMKKVWLDVGYSGKGQQWIQQEMGWEAEIVKHAWTGLRGVWAPQGTEVNWAEIIPPGFHVLPRRWVVERTFAWIGRHRRMSKDYEYLLSSSESMVCLTMIRLMVKRLARAAEANRESMWQAQAA